MAKTIAYIRTSTDKQDLNNQKLEIFEFAKKNKLEVDDFIQMTISSRKTSKERRIDEMLLTLEDADTRSSSFFIFPSNVRYANLMGI